MTTVRELSLIPSILASRFQTLLPLPHGIPAMNRRQML
jgi:hypothetical protein